MLCRNQGGGTVTHLSLFSGIGGIDLAAEWAGFRTVAFVERDPFCQRVLAKHWPEVPIYDDVQRFDGRQYRGVGLLTGGFPCQDVSIANPAGAGIDGERSGLWPHLVRIAEESEAAWLVVENVRQLINRGGERVCAALEAAGYKVWPLVVCAGSAGAPHLRPRVFLVAYSEGKSGLQAHSSQVPQRSGSRARGAARGMAGDSSPGAYWAINQPPVPGMASGFPDRVDRARALGNAVVPAQVYPILSAIAQTLRGEQS